MAVAIAEIKLTPCRGFEGSKKPLKTSVALGKDTMFDVN